MCSRANAAISGSAILNSSMESHIQRRVTRSSHTVVITLCDSGALSPRSAFTSCAVTMGQCGVPFIRLKEIKFHLPVLTGPCDYGMCQPENVDTSSPTTPTLSTLSRIHRTANSLLLPAVIIQPDCGTL